jgi:hypothetical protein
MRQARQQLEVWIDSDLVEPSRVGMLAHDRGQVRFEYDRGWLARTGAFPIDPVQQFLRKRTSLSPAFDLNPNVERRPDHILNIDDADNRPSIEAAMTTANFYRLDPARPLRSARKCSAPSIGGATRPNGPASAPQTLSSPKSRSTPTRRLVQRRRRPWPRRPHPSVVVAQLHVRDRDSASTSSGTELHQRRCIRPRVKRPKTC